MALPSCVVKAEALLQAFGWSVGSCGLANVLTTVRWQIYSLSLPLTKSSASIFACVKTVSTAFSCKSGG